MCSHLFNKGHPKTHVNELHCITYPIHDNTYLKLQKKIFA